MTIRYNERVLKVVKQLLTQLLILRYIVSIYKNNDWCKESQDVVMGVLQELCSTPDANYMSAATCNGEEIDYKHLKKKN